MRIDRQQAAQRLERARVARLATVGRDEQPHLVPVTFAAVGEGVERIVTAVDHKPKTTTALRRIRNIERNPRVCLLADHYEEDWQRLWWVRADGRARTLAATRAPELVRALGAKYEQYRRHPPEGALIVIEVTNVTGWSAGQ
ncbi:TIGR03668 family PPOX class F420-dependent oxidoreductase [Actinopolyspora mortivallis]|uniref:TIGR03668 family PPOX class F420-dependent oxidoreductase n=1 Tax=Actinopolyspora mortivallis TaxID=33906 RepID=UPI00037D2C4A|nr:TIGR03668 family PPOX class F420-dependent oxidoreductase [Actinopolyspora mortivallis]